MPFRVISILWTACVGLAACGHPPSISPRPVQTDTAAVRIVLRDAMAVAAPAFGKAIRERNLSAIRVKVEASAAFPGVTYYRGLLIPQPDEQHVVDAVVAGIGNRFNVLDSESTFSTMLRQVDAEVRGSAAPLDVCAEAIRTTSTHRHPVWPPVMYVSPSTLDDPMMSDRPVPADVLGPPVTTRNGAESIVDAWFLESGRTVLYRCRYDASAPSVRYAEQRVIARTGFPSDF